MALNRMHEDWEKEAPKLMEINSKNPFAVPDDYFTSLSTSLEAAVKAEQLKEKVKSDGFTVPDAYFINLEKRIGDRIISEKFAEQEIPVKKLRFNWIGYAAAACLLFGVSIGVILNNKTNNVNTQLHGIPETEIIQYLQVNSDPGDTPVIIENLGSDVEFVHIDASQQELEQYINSTSL